MKRKGKTDIDKGNAGKKKGKCIIFPSFPLPTSALKNIIVASGAELRCLELLSGLGTSPSAVLLCRNNLRIGKQERYRLRDGASFKIIFVSSGRYDFLYISLL